MRGVVAGGAGRLNGPEQTSWLRRVPSPASGAELSARAALGLPGVEPPDQLAWGDLDRGVEVNPFTGQLQVTLGLRLPLNRVDLGPDLRLVHRSDIGNGPFGVGWAMPVPSITRAIRVAPVDDGEQFLFDGETLVPSLVQRLGWVEDRLTIGDYEVQRYRRQHEGRHDRLECWRHGPSGQLHWRTVDASNVTSLYGITDESRVTDPADRLHTYEWLLAERFDDRGNVVRCSWKREDLVGVDLDQPAERHRGERADGAGGGRYLKRLQYDNASPHDRSQWQHEIVLDYGEHDNDVPAVDEVVPWPVRPDPFSNHLPGFEVRTWRRCNRVLTFARLPSLAEPDGNGNGNGCGEPVLVAATILGYDEDADPSLLRSATHTGYVWRPGAEPFETRSLPAVTFRYQRPGMDDGVHLLDSSPVLDAFVDARAQARWTDLVRDGLPGVLSRLGDAWQFSRNLGAGRFADAEPAWDQPGDLFEEIVDLTGVDDLWPAEQVAHPPDYRPFGAGTVVPSEIGSTGETGSGRDPGGIGVSAHGPTVGYLDLNGDGANDVVVADDRRIRWYPSLGEEGFAEPVVLRLDVGPPGPRVLTADRRQSVHAADITGDGRADLVRVRSGEVTYWPNLGGGRFGAAITMSASPVLPDDRAGPGHVLLADLTGSFATDLVWVGEGEMRWWPNLAGRAFGEGRTIAALGLVPGAHDTSAVDLFGRGSSCVVWVDRTTGAPKVRYLAPVADRRPDRLAGIDNGRGAEVTVTYTTAAELWRRDRAEGRDWMLASPIAVEVVEQIELRDRVGGTALVRRFAFRHAQYDDERQRFAGFAAMEERSSAGAFGADGRTDLPAHRRPVAQSIRRWHHTGALFEGGDVTGELAEEWYAGRAGRSRAWLAGHVLPSDLTVDATRAVHRSLQGWLLRTETRAEGEDLPRTVRERTAWVREVQPARHDQPAVYDARPAATVAVRHDGSAEHPSITHEVTLALDSVGTASRWAHVAYGYRGPLADGAMAGHDGPLDSAQAEHHVLVHENMVSHHVERPTWHRLGVPREALVWNLHGATPAGDQLFDANSLLELFEGAEEREPDSGVATRRLVHHQRSRFWSNDLGRLLDLEAEIESRALVARIDTLALTSGGHDDLREPGLDELLRNEGGYITEGRDTLTTSTRWWATGATVEYDPSRFYLPVSRRDAAGRERSIRFDRLTRGVARTDDAYGNAERFVTHARTQRPWRHVDVNGNTVAWRYDPLGTVLSVAAMGKVADSETPTADFTARGASVTGEGATNGGASVGSGPRTVDSLELDRAEPARADEPTAVVTYRLDVGARNTQPPSVQVRHRAVSGRRDTVLLDRITWLDGLGRVLGNSTASGGGWVVSGLVERDARGRAVRRAEPFRSAESWPDEDEREAHFARGTTQRWDVEGRLVRIDHPNGTFSTTAYGPWSIVRADPVDTVLDSRWFADRQASSQGRAGDFAARQASGQVSEARAAALAAVHAQTPDVDLLDAYGRVVAEQRRLGPDDVVTERRWLWDWQGRLVAVTDGAGRTIERTECDLLGRPLRVEHLDSAPEHFLWAASGELLRYWDAQGRMLQHRYDACGRRTHTVFVPPHGPPLLVARTIWGGGEVAIADAAVRNLVGVPHMRFGAFGLLTVERCDSEGNVVLETMRRATADGGKDWSNVSDLANAAHALPTLLDRDEPLLENDVLTVETTWDALARRVQRASDGGPIVRWRWSRDGRVEHLGIEGPDQNLWPVLVDARYDASGRPTVLRLGNGVRVRRHHDAAGRVLEIVAAVGNGASLADGGAAARPPTQELRFVHDPVGRIMSVRDQGELTASFAYDVRGRLTRAEGVTVASGSVGSTTSDAPQQRWTQSYALDDHGNVLERSHRGAEESTMAVDLHSASNRVRATTRSDSAAGGEAGVSVYQHDAAGNVIDGPGVQRYHWSDRQLAAVDIAGSTHVEYDIALDDHGSGIARRTAVRPDGERHEVVALGDVSRRWRSTPTGEIDEHYAVVVGLPDGTPLATIERRGNRHDLRTYLTDHLGSVVAEQSERGDVVMRSSYDPFGRRIDTVDEERETDGAATHSGVRPGWRSGWEDPDTGLVLLGGRWFSPQLGRYLDGPESLSGLVEAGDFEELRRRAAALANPYVPADANPQLPRPRHGSPFGEGIDVVDALAADALRTLIG